MSVYNGRVVGNLIRCHTSFRVTDNTSPVVDIIKVLGEGGFSFVYLAQDEASGVSTCFETSSLP